MKHSDLLLKGVSERIQNEAKNKKKALLECYEVHKVQVCSKIC